MAGEINGELFPGILRRRFPELPQDVKQFIPQDSQLFTRGYDQVRQDAQLRGRLDVAALGTMVQDLYEEEAHWMAASTRSSTNDANLESPHNQVHVAVGFPMSSLYWAAFHPVFFLHHCNVDRVYEKYIHLEPDSKDEFAAEQARLTAQQDEPNRFEKSYAPFTHPRTGLPLMPSECFDTVKLGYQYDVLPAKVDQLREPPTYARFAGIKPLDMQTNSYLLHVFVVPAFGAAAWAPPAAPDGYARAPGYAGFGAVFGGKGRECPPVMILQNTFLD